MEHQNLLGLIRYHWAIIVVCALLGVSAGQLLITISPREYTASADVFVTVTAGSNTAEIAQSGNFSQQQARNFSAVATREVVLEQVIDSLDLDMSINELRSRVSTSVPLNTSVITISATDGSPERSAAIANTVATYLADVVPALTPRVDGESPVRLQVIETATPPVNPSSPNVPLLLLLGLLGGLVTAAVIVVFRGIVDARVRTKQDLEEVARVPVLATIGWDRRASSRPMALAGDPHSIRAEEYRQLRANLRFLQPNAPHKLFVFTSAMPGEGKSTTAANVSAALAASGVRVCLIEADLRRPSLAAVLDLPDHIGLTHILTGEADIDDAVQHWGPDGLTVILAGDVPPNPSELLESASAVDTIRRIRDRFDVTVIDAPPLNPVSDALVLGNLLGGVILVAGARALRVRELRRAVDRISTVGVPVEGAVLNLSRSHGSSQYRYDYSSRPSRRGESRRAAAGPDRERGDDSASEPDDDLSALPASSVDEVEFDEWPREAGSGTRSTRAAMRSPRESPDPKW